MDWITISQFWSSVVGVIYFFLPCPSTLSYNATQMSKLATSRNKYSSICDLRFIIYDLPFYHDLCLYVNSSVGRLIDH
jgi:hypothetical protein